ncbi:MAG: nucleoside recognition protein [Lachnospiraceae bacterium]|nr:nucleoside recognition protein [Lachnospiraceae bacterium]
MLDILWAGMILLGIVYAALNGTMEAVSEGIWSSAAEAVSLCITLAGTLTVWSGLMKIAQESGLIGKWQRGLWPFIHFLFPTLASDSEAAAYISANVIANMLGLGGAATPAGLKAMKALAKEREQEQNGRAGRAPERLHRKGSKGMVLKGSESEAMTVAASDEMCDFLILNISSLQLIPVNMIAYRAQYGSVNPSWVIVPGLLATAVSTLAGIFFIKVRQLWRHL